MNTIQRGRVLRDTSAGDGLVFVQGNQYPFSLEGTWKSEYAPKANMAVDVEFDDAGKILGIRSITAQSAAGEQASQALDAAGEAAKKMAAEFQAKGLPALQEWAQRIGYPTLIAFAALVIAWFWMPLISVSMGLLGDNSVTFWQGLKFLNSGGLAVLGGGSTGFYGFLVFLSLVAVFLPQVWKDRRAGYGMTFPLVLMLLVGVISYFKMQSQFDAQADAAAAFGGAEFRQMAEQAAEQQQEAAWDAVNFGFGLYVAVIAGIYLAFLGWRKTKAA